MSGASPFCVGSSSKIVWLRNGDAGNSCEDDISKGCNYTKPQGIEVHMEHAAANDCSKSQTKTCTGMNFDVHCSNSNGASRTGCADGDLVRDKA